MLLHCHVRNISVAWRMSLGSGRNMLEYKDVGSYLVLKYQTEAMILWGVAHMIKLIALVSPWAAIFTHLMTGSSIRNITLK